MEYYARVVERLESRVTSTISSIKIVEAYIHMQLNAGVSEEYLSDYYAIIDIETGRLDGLKEALRILQSELLNYHLSQL